MARKLSPVQQAELDALALLPEETIDTSDAPEVTDWSGAVRGRFYRPVKQQVTLRLDADIVDYFKHAAAEPGATRGYQTRINRALRDYIVTKAKEKRA